MWHKLLRITRGSAFVDAPLPLAAVLALLSVTACAAASTTTFVVDTQARLTSIIDHSEELRATTSIAASPGIRTTQEVTGNLGAFAVSGTAEQDVPGARVSVALRVPRQEFVGGTAAIGERTARILPSKGTAPEVITGTSAALRISGPVWTLALRIEGDKLLALTDVWERRGRFYVLSADLFSGPLTRGQTFRATFTIEAQATPDSRPALLTLDASRLRYKFHGFGGNYCFNTDSPVTPYTLANLRSAWARVEMNSREWEPDNDDASPATTRWSVLKARDVEGTKLHRDFLLAQQIQKLGVPYAISAWRLPEWLYSDPREKPVSGQKRIVPREKWDELVEHIASYLLHAKEQYRVEPDLFSFNEANIGVDVLMTPDEHRDFIKLLGPQMQKLGLKTRMLLGDATGPRDTHEWALAAANDPEALRYVGAVAFHSWGGATPAQYGAWGDLAEWLGLPLLVAEVGVDAFAWRGRLYDSFDYGMREVEMYQQLLLHARPQGFMQWEYTGDYSLVHVAAKDIGGFDLKPTSRFWFLKQFSDTTPLHSDALGATSDHPKVLFTAFAGDEKGLRVHTLHIANLGAEREMTLAGLPAGIRSLRIVRTSATENYKDTGNIKVNGGWLKLKLPARCLMTLTSAPAH